MWSREVAWEVQQKYQFGSWVLRPAPGCVAV